MERLHYKLQRLLATDNVGGSLLICMSHADPTWQTKPGPGVLTNTKQTSQQHFTDGRANYDDSCGVSTHSKYATC